MIQLEICASTVESVLAAARGGAQRVELCAGLEEGGVTSSAGLILTALQAAPQLRVHVLIRPRGGDFLYTPAEQDLMVREVEQARRLGAHGVVIGALTEEGELDVALLRRLAHAAEGLSLTLHRAFDMVRCPEDALEAAVEMGFDRILTSGGAASAVEGLPRLAALAKQAAGRIRLMPASGVASTNAAAIVRATGVHDLHASARATVSSRMTYRSMAAKMGRADADEYAWKETSEREVRLLREALDAL